MARGFFNPETGIWRPLGVLGELVILSLLWTLCSIPLLTLGAATAGLYDAAVHSLRRGETNSLSRFWRTFRRELWGAMPSTALWGAALGGAVALYRRFLSTAVPGDRSVVLAVAFVVMLGLLAGLAGWVFPLLSRFTFSFGALDLTALRLGLGHLPATAAMAAGIWGALWVTSRLLYFPIMVTPAALAWWCSLFLEPVFRKYEDQKNGAS